MSDSHLPVAVDAFSVVKPVVETGDAGERAERRRWRWRSDGGHLDGK